MTIPVVVPAALVAASLEALQDVGRQQRECVILWLATREPTAIRVVDLYKPDQRAAEDFFQIPARSMRALFDVLRTRGLMVAAQIHTHPMSAFHSAADDRWAIVRHVGALSIVLPYFAQNTTPVTFFRDAAVFSLSKENEWVLVDPDDMESHIRGGA